MCNFAISVSKMELLVLHFIFTECGAFNSSSLKLQFLEPRDKCFSLIYGGLYPGRLSGCSSLQGAYECQHILSAALSAVFHLSSQPPLHILDKIVTQFFQTLLGLSSLQRQIGDGDVRNRGAQSQG